MTSGSITGHDNDAEQEAELMAEPKKNIHEGHREKLRQRFIRENGLESFEDHQILELLLFYANAI